MHPPLPFIRRLDLSIYTLDDLPPLEINPDQLVATLTWFGVAPATARSGAKWWLG